MTLCEAVRRPTSIRDLVADEERVHGADGVLTVILGPLHRDKDNIVLSPVLYHPVTHGCLNIRTWLDPLAERGDTVFSQISINLSIIGLLNFFLHSTYGIILKP